MRITFAASRPTTHTWSEEQEAVFAWFARTEPGNCVVRARAGTGKTTTIIEGIARAPEQEILLAAFNKTIAEELASRLTNPRAEAKTLHALGFSFLRRHWSQVRVDAASRAWDLARAACGPKVPDPIIGVVKELHTKAREILPFAARMQDSTDQLVALALRFDLDPGEEWECEGWGLERIALYAERAMVLAEERTATIDFADMIFLPLVHGWVTPRYDLVVVDEAQDMTGAQLSLATKACRGRVCIVGDNRQAVYAFRGADSGSLDRLKAELQATELGLKTTYRCPQKVVKLAAKIVPDFRAAPTAPEGTVDHVSAAGMLEQAYEGDFVLSRTNAPLVPICLALLKSGKRARIRGRDIGSSIQTLLKKLQVKHLNDLPQKLANWYAREEKRAKKMRDEEAATHLADCLDRKELILALAEDLVSWGEFEARCRSLFSDDTLPAVMCSTIHRAKGLEADRVFLLGNTFRGSESVYLDDEENAHAENQDDPGQEERNIKYVGITRAKAHLSWSEWPKGFRP